TTWQFAEDSSSGRHFWSDQSEKSYGGQVSFSQPIDDADSKLKFGGFLNKRSREFTSRNLAFSRDPKILPFQYPATYGCPSEDFDDCADSLMSGANIGTLVQLQESTQATDAYSADLDV